jgi:integrase
VAPHRSWLDRADRIAALLDAALDREADERGARAGRRALLATLVYGGLRIGEALDLRWSDVDLAPGTITVRASKTNAGIRTVNVLPVLLGVLKVCAPVDRAPDALVFGTSTGARQGATNVRRRVLARAVELADEQLAKNGLEPMPDGLTPHSLRRTFASLLFAIGEQPPYVMAQMGHTTANLTLAIYARQMDRRDGEPERLRALVNGDDWAHQPVPGATGTTQAPASVTAVEPAAHDATSPIESGVQGA